MKLYLIRHGESLGNVSGNLTSTTDFELTEKGRKQAQRAGNALREEFAGKAVTAYCSSLLRARQTLEEILSSIGQGDLEFTQTDDLKEMDVGILEGMPFDEQARKYPDIDMSRGLSSIQTPEGESYQDIKNRVQRFLDDYLRELHKEENVLIVSHGITLRVLTNLLLKRPDGDVDCLNWMENTAVTVLKFDEEKGCFLIDRLNDYTHLQELGSVNYTQWGIFAEQEKYLLSTV